MKLRTTNLISWLAGAALVALATRGLPARAENPTQGTKREFDFTGCEILAGYNVINGCNTVPDMYITHSVDLGYFAGAGGGSAYASLYCSADYRTVVFAGLMQTGQIKGCPGAIDSSSYASRSACGAEPLCAQR